MWYKCVNLAAEEQNDDAMAGLVYKGGNSTIGSTHHEQASCFICAEPERLVPWNAVEEKKTKRLHCSPGC